jgi:glycerol uptake facilitator-like aquaporin
MDTLITALCDLRPNITRRAAAEALAAFALVFTGCGAIVANAQHDGALTAMGISLVFGLIIMVMCWAVPSPAPP